MQFYCELSSKIGCVENNRVNKTKGVCVKKKIRQAVKVFDHFPKYCVKKETGRQIKRQNKSKTRSQECYMKTKNYRIAPAPAAAAAATFLTVISGPRPHSTLDWACKLYPALWLQRIRRERGRQEEHLRGIDAWDIWALLTGEEEEGEETEHTREKIHRKENQYITGFCCFDL